MPAHSKSVIFQYRCVALTAANGIDSAGAAPLITV